jgi:hypothetical protein
MVPVTAFMPNPNHNSGNAPEGLHRNGRPESQHNQADDGADSGHDGHSQDVDDENRWERPNGWGVFHPLAEF